MRLTTLPKAVRESNIELLRIVLMFMIIGYHLIVHGAKIRGSHGYDLEGEEFVIHYILLKSFLVIAVNCFVFISGFYRITFKVKTLLTLFFQATFFSLLIVFAIDFLSLEPIGLRNYVGALLPVFTSTWWFITAYVGLYLISPLLNSAVDSFNKSQFLLIVVLMTMINLGWGFLFGPSPMGTKEGYSLISFVHIYLVGQYISRHVATQRLEKYSVLTYVGASFLVFLATFVSVTALSQFGLGKVYDYNNPLVLIAAIAFFFCFKRLQFQSRAINLISPYVLGVYLFHDHPFMREHLVEKVHALSLTDSAFLHFFSLLLIAVLIFVAGILLDKLREVLLIPLVHYVYLKFKLVRIEEIFPAKTNNPRKI